MALEMDVQAPFVILALQSHAGFNHRALKTLHKKGSVQSDHVFFIKPSKGILLPPHFNFNCNISP